MKVRIVTLAALLALAAGAPPAVAADGAAVYAQRCATCHGKTGMADTPAGKMLKAPALAGDAAVAGAKPADVAAKVKANPKHASMLKSLGEGELDAVVVYVIELAGKK